MLSSILSSTWSLEELLLLPPSPGARRSLLSRQKELVFSPLVTFLWLRLCFRAFVKPDRGRGPVHSRRFPHRRVRGPDHRRFQRKKVSRVTWWDPPEKRPKTCIATMHREVLTSDPSLLGLDLVCSESAIGVEEVAKSFPTGSGSNLEL